jgi:DnaJ domain/Transmembrane Fragile-X-F protein
MRYDLAFFLCCCKSFLGSDDDGDDSKNYYKILEVDRDASPEELKRGYKKLSLQLHPDKLAQRGVTVTAEHQHRFQAMKEAYEVLSDPHKRETYDTVGLRGMRWMEEPLAMDPQELATNFAKSSVLDRSKIFAIFVGLAISIFLQPTLVCLHVDGAFGDDASWMATLTPLWLWNAFLIFYHSRVILMGPIQKPEHIPAEEWIDPLPMKKRIHSLVRFLLLVVFEILVALKLDHALPVLGTLPWVVVFVPLYLWEISTLYKRLPLARMRIVTVEDLEAVLGKPFSEFTASEKELIGKRYSVVSSTNSPDFEAAQKLKLRARNDVINSIFRIVFVAVLLVQLDGNYDWNWWIVFIPFWFMFFALCYANYRNYMEVQKRAMEKDPTLFAHTGPNYVNGVSYGATADATSPSPLTNEEREELKAQLASSSSRLCTSSCSHGFLLIILFMFVGKLQGADFSSLWIMSPFLFFVRIINWIYCEPRWGLHDCSIPLFVLYLDVFTVS